MERTLLREWEGMGGTEETFYLSLICSRLNGLTKLNTLVHEAKQINRSLKRMEAYLERIAIALEGGDMDDEERLVDEIM